MFYHFTLTLKHSCLGSTKQNKHIFEEFLSFVLKESKEYSAKGAKLFKKHSVHDFHFYYKVEKPHALDSLQFIINSISLLQ